MCNSADPLVELTILFSTKVEALNEAFSVDGRRQLFVNCVLVVLLNIYLVFDWRDRNGRVRIQSDHSLTFQPLKRMNKMLISDNRNKGIQMYAFGIFIVVS